MRNTSIAQFVLAGAPEVTMREGASGNLAIYIHDTADEFMALNDVTLIVAEHHARRVRRAIEAFNAALAEEPVLQAAE
jgi:hypothetical protein